MKVNEPKNVAPGQPGAAASPGVAESAPALPSDRVTTDDAARLNSEIAIATKMAASERALRLQSLTQQVRSGNYHPNVSQLADQILAQADLDARLAKSLH